MASGSSQPEIDPGAIRSCGSFKIAVIKRVDQFRIMRMGSAPGPVNLQWTGIHQFPQIIPEGGSRVQAQNISAQSDTGWFRCNDLAPGLPESGCQPGFPS